MSEHTVLCPHCGRVNDQHSHIAEPREPEDGDVSVCWGCHKTAVFTVGPYGVATRVPTPDEQRSIDADPGLRRAVAAMRESYDPIQALGLLRGPQ